jgi:hypothetical protein
MLWIGTVIGNRRRIQESRLRPLFFHQHTASASCLFALCPPAFKAAKRSSLILEESTLGRAIFGRIHLLAATVSASDPNLPQGQLTSTRMAFG